MRKYTAILLVCGIISCNENGEKQKGQSISVIIDTLDREPIEKLIGVNIESRSDDYQFITINDTNNRPYSVNVQLDNVKYEDILAPKPENKGLVHIAMQRGYQARDILDSMKEYTQNIIRIFKKSGASAISTYPFHRCVLFEFGDTTVIWIQYPNDTSDIELRESVSKERHIKGNWYYFKE